MKVELHSNRKMFKRQYRLSEPDKVEMNRQIQQTETSGVTLSLLVALTITLLRTWS